MSIVFEQFVGVIPLSPGPVFLMDGPAKYLGFSAAPFVVAFSCTTIFLCVAAPFPCFIFRYCTIRSVHNNAEPLKNRWRWMPLLKFVIIFGENKIRTKIPLSVFLGLVF